MAKYAFAGAILLVALAFYMFIRGPTASSPQQITLMSGASSPIGGGRAMM